MNKYTTALFVIITILVFTLTGCSNFPNQEATEDTTTETLATPTPTPAPTQVADSPSTTTSLEVWLPPQFSPNNDDLPASLLLTRLNEFNDLYPNLNVTYRIKAESGPASLLESLKTASNAAPLVLPDLVLLSTRDMVRAAEQELIYPYPENFFTEEEDWYSVSFPMGSFQQQIFGIPFAADALVAVYNPLVVEVFPSSWNNLILEEHTISFPAADPQALYTLALYLSIQGRLLDDENTVILENQPLADILNYYFQALSVNLLPPNASQLDTDESAFSQLLAGRSEIAITWANRYLSLSNPSVSATTPPTIEGNSSTLIKGWVWSVTSPDPNIQAAAAELARFLSAPEFMGPWTEASNLLPSRPSATDLWQNEHNSALAGLLLSVGENVPPPRVVETVGTPIREAIFDVLTGVQTPAEAAQTAVDSLSN